MRARLFLPAVPAAAFLLVVTPCAAEPVCAELTATATESSRELATECVPYGDRTSCHVEAVRVPSRAGAEASWCLPEP